MLVFEGGNIVYDGNTISDEQKAMAIEVDELPEPEEREGYFPQIRANLETQELYYDYLPIPENEE